MVVATPGSSIQLDYYNDPNLRRTVFEREAWRCRYCGDTVSADTAMLDHITPVSNGGPNTAENLATCCMMCNSIKAGRTYDEAAPQMLARLASRILRMIEKRLTNRAGRGHHDVAGPQHRTARNFGWQGREHVIPKSSWADNVGRTNVSRPRGIVLPSRLSEAITDRSSSEKLESGQPPAHSVTSRSSSWISASRALISASISERGRGGTYL